VGTGRGLSEVPNSANSAENLVYETSAHQRLEHPALVRGSLWCAGLAFAPIHLFSKAREAEGLSSSGQDELRPGLLPQILLW